MIDTLFGMPINNLFGMPIVRTKMPLIRSVPIKKHKRRRGQTKAYHERIQKKWVKRYGTREEHCALMINPSMMGLAGPIGAGQSCLMVNDSMIDTLRYKL